MSYFLFVDESGHDGRFSPAQVLGGFVIRDDVLWAFIQKVYALQVEMFGATYPQLNVDRRAARSKGDPEKFEPLEIKGEKFLKTQVFKKASAIGTLPSDERRRLAEHCLREGSVAGGRAISGLAQAKLNYVKGLFEICRDVGGRCLAIIVPLDAPGDRKVTVLRKDYAYLFERFFYFVDATPKEHMGIIVFDELDKSSSHILLGQMQAYYQNFKKGKDRSKRLVPEPFFVHSDLTVGIQVADLFSYVLSWGHDFDRNALVPKRRPDLSDYVKQVESLRIDSETEEGKSRGIYVVYDLRPISERKKGNAAFTAKPSM